MSAQTLYLTTLVRAENYLSPGSEYNLRKEWGNGFYKYIPSKFSLEVILLPLQSMGVGLRTNSGLAIG